MHAKPSHVEPTGDGAPSLEIGARAAIVTGASSGIGRELALGLAARGIHTVVMARRADRLAELAAEIEGRFEVRCHAVEVDLTDMDAGRRAFDEACAIAEEHGWALTVLANNAGVGEWRPFTQVPLARQLTCIDLNIKASTLYTRLFLDQVLLTGQRAYIMNVASMASFLPVPHYAVYSGTKAYMRYLNQSLNYELRGSRVTLTCLCPGATATEFLEVAGNETTKLAALGTLSAAKVAERGLRAMFKGHRVVVPGLSNRFVLAVLAWLPERLGQRVLNTILGLGMKKDWT